MPHDQGVRPTAADPDVNAIHDPDVFFVSSAQDANFSTGGRQSVHGILDRRELPVAVRAIADNDRAASLELAQRPETRATVLNHAGDGLAGLVYAPANQCQRCEKLPRSKRGSPVRQDPRHDFVRRVGPGRDDPIGSRQAKVAEGDFESGAGQRDGVPGTKEKSGCAASPEPPVQTRR